MKKLLLILFTILPLVGLRAESIFVGAQDGEGNCAPVVERWTHFSPDYLINKGEVWHFQFKSYNIKQHDWDTYWLAITNDVERQGNGYNEYLMMLGKNDSWGSGTTTRQFTYTDIEGKTFQEEMDGATVDMTVLYDENNTFYVNSTITTSSGRTFVHNAQTTGANGNQCRVFLTVENASIEITTAEKVSRFPATRAGLNGNYTMVTGADDLKAMAQSGEYYFTIADASRDVMVSWYDNTLSYRQSVNPVEHLTRLFYIEYAKVNDNGDADAEGTTEVYNLRNVEHSRLLMQTGDPGAEYSISYNDQAITVKWTNLDIAFPNNTSVCTMAWHLHNNGNNYFGAWDGFPDLNTMALDGTENLAGNKSGSNIGTYVIYAIKRSDLIAEYIGESAEKDITKFVLNPSFESSGWENRGNMMGWNKPADADGMPGNINNTSFTSKAGDYYTQRWHENGTFGFLQTLHVPAGCYRLTAAATAREAEANSSWLFMNDDKTAITAEIKNYTTGSYLSEASSLTIGAQATFKNNGDRWFAIDNFRLMYVGKDMYVGEGTVVNPKYLQPGKPVTISYNDVLPIGKDLALAAETNVTVDGNKVDITLTDDAKGFTFSMPANVQPSTEYTLRIPAGTIGDATANVYNKEQTLTLTTANIFDGTYYLATTSYNGQKMFLSRGAHYGTEAVLDKYGLAVQVVTAADNTTTFQFIDNELYLFHDKNNTSIFADGGENTGKAWKTHKEEGGFRMDFDGGSTVRIDDGTLGNYLHTNSATSDYRVIWQTVTKDERDAIIAAYPAANKTSVATAAGISNLDAYISENGTADLTNLILNNKSGEQGAWTWHGVDRNPKFSWTESNTCFEWYNGSGYATQTVSNLKPGVYKVTVDAIDRLGSVVQENKVRGLGYVENLSYLKANGEQVRIKNWYDMHEYYKDTKDAGYPYWREASAQCMTDGHATVEVYTYVGEDGNLNLEINKPSYILINDHNEQSNFVFNNFTLTYYGPTATLSDKVAFDYTPATYSTVSLTRTIKAGWNTICLPFATTAEEVAGKGAIAYEFASASEENELSFDKVETMEANVPYLFYCETAAENPSFSYVALEAAEPATVTKGAWSFKGNYTPSMDMNGKYGVTGNKVRLAGSGSTLNGMRAYLEGPAGASASVKVNNFGDEETGVESLQDNKTTSQQAIYDLSGRRVNKTQKGIYIINGKKVMK